MRTSQRTRLTVCNQPGCPELTTNQYCAEHQHDRQRQADQRRSSSTQRGYNTHWRKTQRAFLRNHPICECDDPTCTRIATVVHHIDGQGPLGPRGHDPSNLQALAKVCHDRLTAREHGGWQRTRVGQNP